MYKNFKLTEKERQQILESHMSHGYRKPLNELDSKEIDLVRGKPDFKTQTGLPVGDYVSRRNASRQFQQDFKKDFADPSDEFKPYWEKDRPNSDGDSEIELDIRTTARQADREMGKKSEKESDLSNQQAREERIKLRRKIASIMDLSGGDMDEDLEKYLNKLRFQYRELENVNESLTGLSMIMEPASLLAPKFAEMVRERNPGIFNETGDYEAKEKYVKEFCDVLSSYLLNDFESEDDVRASEKDAEMSYFDRQSNGDFN